MTHFPETGAINRFHFVALVLSAGFVYTSGMKISGAKVNVAEVNVNDD